MSYLLRRTALLVVVLTLPALAARAQDTTAAAREHYQKGTSYYDLGRYDDAIKEFEAAYELKNDPALLYNLAQSYRLAGNAEQALHFYRTYLRRVPKASNRAEIEGRITALEQLVAQKSATQTAPPNQTIPPAGTTTPPAGADTTTNPATATTTTTTPPPPPPPPVTTTPPPMDQPPVGGPGTMGPPTVATSTPPPDGATMQHSGGSLKLAGAITAGVGAVLIVAGAIEGSSAVAAANQVNNDAKNGNAFDPAVERRGKSAQRAEAWLLVIGALVGAGGGVLYYLGRRNEHAGEVTLTPVASASEAGAMLRVTF